MSKNLTEAFRTEISQHNRSSGVERIDSLSCASENFDSGVQYNIYGPAIPILPVIEVVDRTEGILIDEFYHVSDAIEPHLSVFVADVPQDEDYPGFA